MTDVRERTGDRERDVTLHAGLLVERGLVQARRTQQGADHERQDCHHQRIARGRERPSVLAEARSAATRCGPVAAEFRVGCHQNLK